MKKITIETKFEKMDRSWCVWPAMVIEPRCKIMSFVFAWLNWSFELTIIRG